MTGQVNFQQYSRKSGGHQERGRSAASKTYGSAINRGWNERDASLQAEARYLAFTRQVDPDGQRLPDLKDHKVSRRQNRNGQAKDVANAVAIGQTITEAIEAATPDQRRLLLAAFDKAAPAIRQRTSLAKRGRLNRLYGLRKSVRTIVGYRHGAHGISHETAAGFFETLLKLQAEIAFYGNSIGAEWHVHELARVLPGYCETIGDEEIMTRLDCTIAWLSDLYDAAARAAANSDTTIVLPSLITSADIGVAHQISRAETLHVFPGGGHGIRAYDSKVVKRRKRTVEEAQGDAAYVREKDEVALFFGRSRKTVNRWVRDGSYDDKLEEMRSSEACPNRVTPTPVVTPLNENEPLSLIVDNKAQRLTDGVGVTGVTGDNEELPDLSRSREFLAALAAWKGIKVASLRVYRQRGTLQPLIDTYLNFLDDLYAEEALAAMCGEEAA